MRYKAIESKILEFKERLENYSRFLETVVAFANTQGGTIIIGIRDSDPLVSGYNSMNRSCLFSESSESLVPYFLSICSIGICSKAVTLKICRIV